MRQQRTNYKRQTIGTSQSQPLLSMSWWVEGLSGQTAQLRILGPRDSLVINGVPDLKPQDIGANPISCEFAPSPSPDLYSILLINYDVDITAARIWALDQGSPALRNRQGGMLAPSVQPYPNPAFSSQDIQMSLDYWEPDGTYFNLSGATPPYAFGPGWTLYNTTQSFPSRSSLWSVNLVYFAWDITLAPGDEIVWTASPTLVKGQLGGTLIAGSTILL
jgi:hypothetical protein